MSVNYQNPDTFFQTKVYNYFWFVSTPPINTKDINNIKRIKNKINWKVSNFFHK